MTIREFDILISPRKSTLNYKMKVEVFYESGQVIRYRITGGERSFEMEKQLHKKFDNWRIISGFEMKSDNYESAAMALRDIQLSIENAEKELSGKRPGANPRNI